MQKSVLNSPRLKQLKKQKYKILRIKIFLSIFLFLLVLVALSFLSRWEKFNINKIEISGNKVVETEMIEDVVKENISGNYFWFFPKTNFIIYPQAKIETELKNKFKRIKTVSANDKNIKTLEILLTERVASYTYCGVSVNTETENEQKCFFMDEEGYIFAEAPFFSGEVYLKFYGKVADQEIEDPSGKYFYQSDFSKLISFKEKIEKIGLKPVIFFIGENGYTEMFLSSLLKSELGPKIIFNLDSNLDVVLENLETILSSEPLKTDFRKKYASLLYIDLSFGNKVYYKFK